MTEADNFRLFLAVDKETLKYCLQLDETKKLDDFAFMLLKKSIKLNTEYGKKLIWTTPQVWHDSEIKSLRSSLGSIGKFLFRSAISVDYSIDDRYGLNESIINLCGAKCTSSKVIWISLAKSKVKEINKSSFSFSALLPKDVHSELDKALVYCRMDGRM